MVQAGGTDPHVSLVDDAAHEAAVLGRRRQREQREQAQELASWIGTLRDLAERGTSVCLQLAGGRVHRGALVAVARDHVVLSRPAPGTVLVALQAIRYLQPAPGTGVGIATGEREHAQDRTLIEALARLVEQQLRLVIGVADLSDPLPGRPVGLGEDVLTLLLDGPQRTVVMVPTTAITDVAWERAAR